MPSHKACLGCGRLIPAQRLRIIPETETCVECSHVAPRTEADVEIDEADPDELVRAVRNTGD